MRFVLSISFAGGLLRFLDESVRQNNRLPNNKEIQNARYVVALYGSEFENAIVQMLCQWHSKHWAIFFKKLKPAKYLRLHFAVKCIDKLLNWLPALFVRIILDFLHWLFLPN